MSPAVLRSRQDAAYRSVAALQLRVEELTLEVTKVWSYVFLTNIDLGIYNFKFIWIQGMSDIEFILVAWGARYLTAETIQRYAAIRATQGIN